MAFDIPELPDFDTLKDLAEKDPDALESLRQVHVNNLIDNAPARHQQRLKGLQFQIDAQRKIHHNPLSACIKISEMMHESFNEMRYLLNSVSEGNQSETQSIKTARSQQQKSSAAAQNASTESPQTPAQILQFRGA